MRTLLLVSLLLTQVPLVWANEEMNIPKVPASAEFTRIKQLAGTWEGTSKNGEKTEPAKVEYSMTSGGTVVVEKLFAGTEHEMVSVYSDENGKLTMTHYCMLPAKPKMDLKSSNEKEIVLDFSPSNKVDVSQPHMHGLALSFPSKDELIQTWQCSGAANKGHETTVSLKKVK